MTNVNAYDVLYGQSIELKSQLDAAIEAVMAQVKDELEKVNASPLAQELADVEARLKVLEEAAKSEVISGRATVKGGNVQFVYTPPGYKWDDKMLNGMLALIPQIAAARSEKPASVSIRRVK